MRIRTRNAATAQRQRRLINETGALFNAAARYRDLLAGADPVEGVADISAARRAVADEAVRVASTCDFSGFREMDGSARSVSMSAVFAAIHIMQSLPEHADITESITLLRRTEFVAAGIAAREESLRRVMDGFRFRERAAP